MAKLTRPALIEAIVAHLRFHARDQNKPFDGGDLFLSLAFRTDAELKHIAKLTGVW